MSENVLVSCLCPTHNRVSMLRQAVSCFLQQTYQERELLIICQSDDQETREYLASLNEPTIRAIEVPASPRLTTGALRNISLQAAHGLYIATWDDDDWHHPERLAEQIDAIQSTDRKGCVLGQLILYDETSGSAYLSARRLWEASLVAERDAVPPYPDMVRGSDTSVIARMTADTLLVGLDRPELYIYRYHGKNLWNHAHWTSKLLSRAQALPQEENDRIKSLLQ